jgi:ATP-dependent DNA ligase
MRVTFIVSIDRTPLPPRIKPQLAALVKEAPDGPNWAHEIKLDACNS